MAGHYAIKSIAVLDFIDIEDIAIMSPLQGGVFSPKFPAYPTTYRDPRKVSSRQSVHHIAVPMENPAA
jgi:hypothetical protein